MIKKQIGSDMRIVSHNHVSLKDYWPVKYFYVHHNFTHIKIVPMWKKLRISILGQPVCNLELLPTFVVRNSWRNFHVWTFHAKWPLTVSFFSCNHVESWATVASKSFLYWSTTNLSLKFTKVTERTPSKNIKKQSGHFSPHVMYFNCLLSELNGWWSTDL